MNLPKKQGQRLIPEYLLKYAEELQENHPDPSEEWGGSGSEYTAGDGIDITEDVISVDDTIARTSDLPPTVSGSVGAAGYWESISIGPTLAYIPDKVNYIAGAGISMTEDASIVPVTTYEVSANIKGATCGGITVGLDILDNSLELSVDSNVPLTNRQNTFISPQIMGDGLVISSIPSYGSARQFELEPATNSFQVTDSSWDGYNIFYFNPPAWGGSSIINIPTGPGTVALTSDIITSYNDLTDKPTIPTVTNSITYGSTDAVSSGAVYDAIGDIETLLAAI